MEPGDLLAWSMRKRAEESKLISRFLVLIPLDLTAMGQQLKCVLLSLG